VVTKEQAQAASYRQTFHYTGKRQCSRVVGPRGGETVKVTEVRVNGSCQTWKRDPQRFRLPVKYGLYESSAIEHTNAADWHSPEDCPLRGKGTE
jgi:hypothetical protein